MDSIGDERTQFAVRLRIAAIVVGVVFALFVGRLWVLQLTQWTTYAKGATANRTDVVWDEAPRGLICDRNGVVLADNRAVWTVNIIPADFPDDQEAVDNIVAPDDQEAVDNIVAQLAGILGQEHSVSTADLRKQISEICQGSGPEARPLEGAGEDVPLEVVQAIEARKYEMPGVVIKQDNQRHYPHGKLASHMIGYGRPINVNLANYERVKDFCYPQSSPAPGGLLNIEKPSQYTLVIPSLARRGWKPPTNCWSAAAKWCRSCPGDGAITCTKSMPAGGQCGRLTLGLRIEAPLCIWPWMLSYKR